MTVYIILWITVSICCLAELFLPKISFHNKILNYTFWICFLSLMWVGIARGEGLGVDVGIYRNYFYFLGEMSFSDCCYALGSPLKIDYGYYLLGYIFYNLISPNFYLFKCLLYIFTLGVFSILVYRKSSYPSLSFLIYIGLGFLEKNFCILRMSVAIAICVIAYMFWEKKNIKSYIMLVLIAATFHKTALIFLALLLTQIPLFKSTRFSTKIFISILCCLSYIILLPIVLRNYKGGLYLMNDGVVSGTGEKMLLIYCIILFVFGYLTKRVDFNSELFQQYNIAFFIIYFQLGAIFFSTFTRIISYFAIIVAISIPNLLKQLNKRSTYFWIYYSIFSFLFIYSMFTNSCKIVPFISNF